MKVDEQFHCKDCDGFNACEYYNNRKGKSQICKNFQNQWKMIEELEKIKAEIGKCSDYVITNHNNTEADMNKLDGIILATTIIDTEISELKGENDES